MEVKSSQVLDRGCAILCRSNTQVHWNSSGPSMGHTRCPRTEMLHSEKWEQVRLPQSWDPLW